MSVQTLEADQGQQFRSRKHVLAYFAQNGDMAELSNGSPVNTGGRRGVPSFHTPYSADKVGTSLEAYKEFICVL